MDWENSVNRHNENVCDMPNRTGLTLQIKHSNVTHMFYNSKNFKHPQLALQQI